jgi:glutathione synthase/RimK-type ligase-like ATP-grasp enzyme
MPNVALVSYTPPYGEFDHHLQDEHMLKQPLAVRGITVSSVAWDAPNIAWASYDALIIRSTWDYHLRYAEFLAWLQHVIASGARLYNAPSLLMWNMDKVYLRELEAEGVPLLPTVFVGQGEAVSLADVIASHGWSEAVVKPSISAGGDNTWRVQASEATHAQSRLEAQLGEMSVMIQQYAPQISDGEYSFLFFNGQFSHATRKIPAQGDMFVHEHRGGKTYAYSAPAELIAQASNIVRIAQKLTGELPLYARVDSVLEGDKLILMELEMVEPYLYMPYADAYATERLADAIAQRLLTQ